MMAVNLIPMDRRNAKRAHRACRAWLRALGAYAGLAVAACVLVNLPVSAEAPRVRMDIERLEARLEKAERAGAQVQKSIAEKRLKLNAARAVGDHPDWSLLMESIARVRNGEIVLEAFDLATTKVEIKPAPSASPAGAGASPAAKPGAKAKTRTVYTVRIVGYSPTPGGVFTFARGLEGLNVFEQVAVKDTRAVALGSMPATRFEIDATIPESAEGTR